MNRYIVIRRSSIEELEQAVNAYITQKGYEPQGGIIGIKASLIQTEILWCQALWKRVIDVL